MGVLRLLKGRKVGLMFLKIRFGVKFKSFLLRLSKFFLLFFFWVLFYRFLLLEFIEIWNWLVLLCSKRCREFIIRICKLLKCFCNVFRLSSSVMILWELFFVDSSRVSVNNVDDFLGGLVCRFGRDFLVFLRYS